MTPGALYVDSIFEDKSQNHNAFLNPSAGQPGLQPSSFSTALYSQFAPRPSGISGLKSSRPHSLERVLPGLALSGNSKFSTCDTTKPPLSPPGPSASLWGAATPAERVDWPTERPIDRTPISKAQAITGKPVRPPIVKVITPPHGVTPIQKSSAPTLRYRQPPKSDFALWVGNLPPQPSLNELCKVFASPDILSVYLIQRTGCAFVNFRSKEGLDEAVEEFNKNGGCIRDHKLLIKAQHGESNEQAGSTPASAEAPTPPLGGAGSPNRYFVCKSLSVNDLETARKTSLWSTQLHNAERFNEAFRTAENVYFIFSANRTSSYFGYARMESEIPEEEVLPPPASTEEPVETAMQIEFTKPIYDPLTGKEICPAGEIVEDTRRACLFWQVLDCPKEEVEQERWTAPCKIRWLSGGSPLSFSHTKHLRNPLNANKPVKIARDGTEIEPSVGEQLCSLFS
ncbi:hypothetical protein B9G98_00054 [Wickerhamiella sorbophila]|uniref:Uncharacterized protein n=1 Tax=Wickerhamiella sorbophila TaxID=45607 RepID=A0A2T0FBP8_9ASCO|nr:hypothetical protein B9G98_00054 [Wickerhamiella sorbophila]PRT52434.1 hypothetical protein B9G98_00054 [Wickerhamiella sorbophila]